MAVGLAGGGIRRDCAQLPGGVGVPCIPFGPAECLGVERGSALLSRCFRLVDEQEPVVAEFLLEDVVFFRTLRAWVQIPSSRQRSCRPGCFGGHPGAPLLALARGSGATGEQTLPGAWPRRTLCHVRQEKSCFTLQECEGNGGGSPPDMRPVRAGSSEPPPFRLIVMGSAWPPRTACGVSSGAAWRRGA